MRLRSSPKCGRGGHRVIEPEQTLKRIRPLAALAGVTRLADITGLDRIGIPAYSAIIPQSPDIISIYNGKGFTKADAACGALMEAIERRSAWSLRRTCMVASFREVNARFAALDPAGGDIAPHPDYTPDVPLHWVEGFEFCTDAAILVPASMAGYMLPPAFGPPCSEFITSNGLASGNTIEEAICHALCELIERDAWTLAELAAFWRPRWRQQRTGGTPAAEVTDDNEIFPEVDLTAAPPRIRRLHRRFLAAGLQPVVKDITSDLGIATIMATAGEDGPQAPLAHLGIGTHPDAETAVSRALTELAQSRAADIQGVREDISAPHEDVPAVARHAQRARTVERESWYHRPTLVKRCFADLPSARNSDILEDIRLMMGRLQQHGIDRIVAVDLTDPDLGIPVVRMLVPKLESWVVHRSLVGARAARLWRDN